MVSDSNQLIDYPLSSIFYSIHCIYKYKSHEQRLTDSFSCHKGQWQHRNPRLLSSLVWINSGVIFVKMHFLLISENESFHEIKCDVITNFMDFMCTFSSIPFHYVCLVVRLFICHRYQQLVTVEIGSLGIYIGNVSILR